MGRMHNDTLRNRPGLTSLIQGPASNHYYWLFGMHARLQGAQIQGNFWFVADCATCHLYPASGCLAMSSEIGGAVPDTQACDGGELDPSWL